MSLHDRTEAARVAARPAAARRGLGLALLIIATAQLMLVLDDTIVNIALPTIQRSLHLPASSLNWVISFYALTRGGANGWTDAGTLVAFAIGAVLLLAFAAAERLSRAPMLPASVVRDRNRAGANAVMLLLGTAMLAMYYLLTLYMQLVRGYSALHTGLAYLPNVVGLGIAAGGLGPRLLAALPARAVVAAGMLISACGLAWYAAMLTPTSNYYAVLLPAMLASGIGAGLTFVGCTSLGMRGVAPRNSGVAAGLLNTSVQCGAALGLGALAAIASAVTRSQQAGHAPALALTNGYVAGLLAGAVIYAVGAIVAAITINARLSPAEPAGH